MSAATPLIYKPAFAYTGGKGRLLSHILPHIPEHHTYVEPFCGGAAVLLAKEPSAHEVINDVNGDLIAFFRYCKFHAPALLAELEGWPASRKNFIDLKAAAPLTDLQRAARWYWLQVNSFGGKGEHVGRDRRGFRGYDREMHGERIRALSERLRRVFIESQDWEQVVDFYDSPETFFFFDPPYLNCSHTAYPAFDAQQMWRLAGALRRIEGNFLLTVNDAPETREIFGGFPHREMSIRYSLAKHKTGKVSGELLIGNCLETAEYRKAA